MAETLQTPDGRPLHLQVVIDSLAWGGAESLLADYAVGAERIGIRLSVAFMLEAAQPAERLVEVGIEPTLLPAKSMIGRKEHLMMRRHLKSTRPDLLHTHLGTSDFIGGIAARSLGIPTVSTIHVADWGETLRERTKDSLDALVRRRFDKKVITVSDAARRVYLDRGWDRPEHVVTVHNGIIGDLDPGAGGRVRSELGIGEGDFVIAMVGVLRVEKRHDVAARAVGMLLSEFPQARLLIVGDGPMREEVERAVVPLGDRAIMAGYREDVLEVLDASDALVHTSRTDAFPTALIEAMAARVPVVATAVDGVPEIVRDSETGILLSPPPDADAVAEALGTLLRDAELRSRMGTAGRERFEREFTVDRWLDRIVPIYREALGQMAGPATLAK